MKGEEEIAYKMMQYINAISPYINNAFTWTISPMATGNPFSHVGNITTREQLCDPYGHQDEIFPNTRPPYVNLS
jgi:hypothetical protein